MVIMFCRIYVNINIGLLGKENICFSHRLLQEKRKEKTRLYEKVEDACVERLAHELRNEKKH